MKRGLAAILKAVAGISAGIFLLTPVTGMGLLVFVIALFVAIVAGGVAERPQFFWFKLASVALSGEYNQNLTVSAAIIIEEEA